MSANASSLKAHSGAIRAQDQNENGQHKLAKFLEMNGAGDEIRTHDIHLGKVALYH